MTKSERSRMSDRSGFPSRFLITDKPLDEAFERLGSIPGLLVKRVFVIRISSFIRHSSLKIRHFGSEDTLKSDDPQKLNCEKVRMRVVDFCYRDSKDLR